MTKARATRRLALAATLAALAFGSRDATTASKAEAIDALLTASHRANAFHGAALVAERGRVIVRKGYGFADVEWQVPNDASTKFRLGSITKPFTATVISQLVAEGRLAFETTLDQALPYYRRDTGRRVTIHHLLTHTSGIPSYTTPTFFRESSRTTYAVREFVEKFCSGDLEFEPGAEFRYNNSGYFLLGAIVEAVVKKPYEDAVRERIFAPLGMHGSGYDLSSRVLPKRARGYERVAGGLRNADFIDMSIPFAAGSLYSTVDDLFLWDQALYGDRLLNAAMRQRMFTPGLGGYGYGWGIRRERIGPGGTERLTTGHGGGIHGFSTLLMRMPEDRHLIVLLDNTAATNLRALAEQITKVLYARQD